MQDSLCRYEGGWLGTQAGSGALCLHGPGAQSAQKLGAVLELGLKFVIDIDLAADFPELR